MMSRRTSAVIKLGSYNISFSYARDLQKKPSVSFSSRNNSLKCSVVLNCSH